MIRNLLILAGLFVFTMSATGCRAGGSQPFGQQFGQSGIGIGSQVLQGLQQPHIGSQILQGVQQPILGGNSQQLGGNLPTADQAQQALGQFGRNLGTRFSNGLLNQGVNQVISGLF